MPVVELIDEQKTIAGNPIGSPKDVQAMLDFVAARGIRPWVERYPMSRAQEAVDALREGRLRYRAVLEQDL